MVSTPIVSPDRQLLEAGRETPFSGDSPTRLQRIKNAFKNTARHSSRPNTSHEEGASTGGSHVLQEINRLGSSYEGGDTLADRHQVPSVEITTSESSESDLLRPRPSKSYPDGLDSWRAYFEDLSRTCWETKGSTLEPESEEASKRRQLRLIMFEVLEHVDFVTDALLLNRVFVGLFSPTARRSDRLAFVLLSAIMSTSLMAYLTRKYTIYHKIKSVDQWIFCPGYAFFHTVRACGSSPERQGTLLMYERLQWTYTLVMRILEDLPQLLVVFCLLAQDGGIFLILDVATSLMTLVASSFRMGSLYPYKGSMALLISSAPPIESPVVNEASPTTRAFPWLLTWHFSALSLATFICARIVVYSTLSFTFYSLLSVCAGGAAFASGLYASFLSRQFHTYSEYRTPSEA